MGFNVAGAFWNIGLDAGRGEPGDRAHAVGHAGADNAFASDIGVHASQVKWYCFTLAGAADDTTLKT